MSLVILDTLDDRKEIHRMLQVIHPRSCVAWLKRQCDKCESHGQKPGPIKLGRKIEDAIKFGGERHYRLATEVYFDFWSLVSQYNLDPIQATKELEQVAKGKA